FRARAETTALAGFPRHTLLATARDLVGRRGRLRLTTWLAACRGYDAAALAPPRAADELDERFAEVRELIAATVEDLAHERHRLVLGRRLDLDGSGAATLAELGVTLGVTRERVRQVQEQALREVAAASRDVRRPAARLAAVLASMLGADTAVEAAQRGADAVAEFAPDRDPAVVAYLLLRLAGTPPREARHRAAEVATLATADDRAHGADDHGTPPARAVARWLDRAEWPTSGASATPPGVAARREVDLDSERAGIWYSGKLGRAVNYESALELRVIQALDAAPAIASFQEQPLAIPYRFDGMDRTYYPDLIAVTTDGRVVLIEVKQLRDMALSISRAKFAAARAFAHERGWGWVAVEWRRTHADLADHRVRADVECAVSERLAEGPMAWLDVRRLREEVPFTHTDIAALAVRHDWTFRHAPYLLALPPHDSAVDKGVPTRPHA
ncbi:MAG TPA: TnsA endonuclease N-terminal domain-containing protein, partial [Frankiaceae bacterium]|nr:TnsA endonuclease N-terminal domain-containing protein [Frankiaceae bacterium]